MAGGQGTVVLKFDNTIEELCHLLAVACFRLCHTCMGVTLKL